MNIVGLCSYNTREFLTKNKNSRYSIYFILTKCALFFLQVGYCQGTAFIVGLLLMQMPEEDAFAVLVRIMQNYRMREMFKPSMAELGLCMYQLDVLVQEHIPDLSAHFQVTRYACNLQSDLKRSNSKHTLKY